MTICRVLGASTKIIDKWDEIAYMRDVIIAGKDCEVDDARKLLKDTKDKQKQLGKVFFYFFFYLRSHLRAIEKNYKKRVKRRTT